MYYREFSAKALAALINNQQEFVEKDHSWLYLEGKPTEHTCPECRQFLYQYDPQSVHLSVLKKATGEPKPSQRKRQRKKNLKKWQSTRAWGMYNMALKTEPLISAYLKCPDCGYQPGVYQISLLLGEASVQP
jgi:DNA-directed RNA polymerase subunit M/transcription elongation factor TFIIS